MKGVMGSRVWWGSRGGGPWVVESRDNRGLGVVESRVWWGLGV